MTANASTPDARKISDTSIRAYAAVLIRDYAANLDYLDLAEHMAAEDSIGGVLLADLNGPEIDDVQRRILDAAHGAAIVSSWPDERQPDGSSSAAELVEIFTDFIEKWDRSHEVITVGLPHLPQLRISHLRRATATLQRLEQELADAVELLPDTEQEDFDTHAVGRVLSAVQEVCPVSPRSDALDELAGAATELGDRFATRITNLATRDKAGTA